MQISGEVKGGIAVVRFEGSLDTKTAAAAQEYLDRTIDGGAAKVLLSFDKVDFVSSAGLRVLLLTAKKLRARSGGMRVCGLNESVAEVFAISGLTTIFKVFPTEERALADF
jgi:anti-sigma B factor antagonist